MQADSYMLRAKKCLEESGYNVRLIDEDQTSNELICWPNAKPTHF